MILVDTSIWVDHLRRGNAILALLLERGQVLLHPFIIGELACGSLKNRKQILELMHALPRICMAERDEVLHLIETEHLDSQGIGWVDAHLLASALLSHALIWTSDKKLLRRVDALGIAFHASAPGRS
jgi:predicted nucleic acid-binding protein